MQWQGLRFHATGLWQAGANLGVQIGIIANPSDLVSAHTTRLDSWWLEQCLCEQSIKVRPGGDLKILTSYVTGTPIKTKSSVHTAIGAGVRAE